MKHWINNYLKTFMVKENRRRNSPKKVMCVDGLINNCPHTRDLLLFILSSVSSLEKTTQRQSARKGLNSTSVTQSFCQYFCLW